MSTRKQKGFGRTQWDLLIELIHNRKAVLWAAILGWLGIAAAVAAIWSGYAIIQLTGISSRTGSKPLSCDDYEISISSPSRGESVTPPFNVSGHSKQLPEGYELWVFTTLPPGSREEYWPLAPSDVGDRQWRVNVSPVNWKSGDTKRYAVFIVGKDGQALIRYYKTTMNAMSKPGAEWMPLTETTSDMLKCVPAYMVKFK